MLSKIRNTIQWLIDKWIYLVYGKKIIFKNNPYFWCEIPVPENYPIQSQTHPSVVSLKEGWKGANIWLATTPYPEARVEYENPCIYYADSSLGKPATTFMPIKNNPILEWPGGSKFNSDVELFFENNTLYSLIREYDNETASKELKIQHSADGQTWSLPIRIYKTTEKSEEILSPSLVRLEDRMRIYCLNGTAGIGKKGRCTGIDIFEGSDIEHQDYKKVRTGTFLNKEELELEPWHCDVFEYKGKLYMVLCSRNNKKKTLRSPMETYLAVSENTFDFYIFPKPLVRHIKTYRPTAYVDNGQFFLYFSSVGKYLNDGSDRNIGVTVFDMENLLTELQK